MLSGTELYERSMRRVLMTLGARSHHIPFEGGALHALDVPGHGPLPPVVLLHGFSASGASQYWGMVWRLRSRVSRIVVPDLPGHGLSSVGFLDGDVLQRGLSLTLDRMAREPVVVFASSLSGALAVRYAAIHPQRLLGLMLCSPGGAPITPKDHARLLHLFRIRGHDDALTFVDHLFPRRHPLRHLYAWGVRQQFNRPHLLSLLERADGARFLAPDELARLRMPVHVVWGSADRILPESHFEFFRRHLPPGTVFDRPASFGHAPFVNEAGPLTQKLLGFCDRVRARRETRTPAQAVIR